MKICCLDRKTTIEAFKPKKSKDQAACESWAETVTENYKTELSNETLVNSGLKPGKTGEKTTTKSLNEETI